MDKRTRKLLRENNKSEKVLPEEANDLLTDIVVYLRSSNLSMYNQELIRRDVTQMLIEGDERGEYAKDVIGEDYEVFCDMLIAALPELTAKERRLAIIYQAITSTWFLLLCWLGFYCASLIGDGGKWNGQVDFSLNSVLFICCFAVLYEIIQNKQKLLNNGMGALFFESIILCFILMLAVFSEAVSVKAIFSVHILILIAIIAILFVACTICENILDKKSGS